MFHDNLSETFFQTLAGILVAAVVIITLAVILTDVANNNAAKDEKKNQQVIETCADTPDPGVCMALAFD